MGLDQYLNKRVKQDANVKKKIVAALENEDSGVELGYWRKANQIQGWFINNCANGDEDCSEMIVTKEKAEELLSIIKNILSIESAESQIEAAEDHLPPHEGFFFGTYEIDGDYFEQLEDTKKILEKAIEITDFDNEEIIYMASW